MIHIIGISTYSGGDLAEASSSQGQCQSVLHFGIMELFVAIVSVCCCSIGKRLSVVIRNIVVGVETGKANDPVFRRKNCLLDIPKRKRKAWREKARNETKRRRLKEAYILLRPASTLVTGEAVILVVQVDDLPL